MGAWRGSAHIRPAATLTWARRVVREHSALRHTTRVPGDIAGNTVAGAAGGPTERAIARQHAGRRVPERAPWARSGVRHPNPRMSEGLVARLLHP